MGHAKFNLPVRRSGSVIGQTYELGVPRFIFASKDKKDRLSTGRCDPLLDAAPLSSDYQDFMRFLEKSPQVTE